MIIKRVIDGKEYNFELTRSEQWKAFGEYEKEIYSNDLKEHADGLIEDGVITREDFEYAFEDMLEDYAEQMACAYTDYHILEGVFDRWLDESWLDE